VKEIAISADVRISKAVAVPVDTNGKKTHPNETTPQDGKNPVDNDSYVGANFKIKVASLQDLLIEVDLPSFEPTSFPGWAFKVHKTVVDLSDTKNSPTVVFPEIYCKQQLLVPGNENLWRGFYAGDVSITLPPEFRKKNSEERIKIEAKGLIIDNFGLSGNF